MVLSVRANEPRKMATLELDYMRADGQYSFDPPACYMSANISSYRRRQPIKGRRVYQVSGASLVLANNPGGSRCPMDGREQDIRIVTDGAIAYVDVEVKSGDGGEA